MCGGETWKEMKFYKAFFLLKKKKKSIQNMFLNIVTLTEEKLYLP